VEKRSDGELRREVTACSRGGAGGGVNFPVVEQRAPASGCRDHASRLRVV